MTLDGTLHATADEGAVEFRFTVENTGSEAVELQFSDAQRFDVVVEADGDDGHDVWRHAEGTMFAQMLGSETLSAGETADFRAEWTEPEPGEYAATAVLTARNADCEASVPVSVPVPG